MYRFREGELEVFLAHPGGPLFTRKDRAAWTIPKGLPMSGEDLLQAAIREFGEETGLAVSGPLLELGNVRQKGGKIVNAWAFAGTVPEGFVPQSNEIELIWPPRSGRLRRYPEVDRAEFFTLPVAFEKIIPAQAVLIERLVAKLSAA